MIPMRQQMLRRVFLAAAFVATAVVPGCGTTAVSSQPADDLSLYDVSSESAIAPIPEVPTTIGLADSDLYGLPPDRIGDAIGLIRASGVTNIRVMIPWAAVQLTPTTYDWSMVDRMVESAVARGMTVLATLNSTPWWAVPPGVPAIRGRPASADAFGSFAAAVAEHFKGKVAAYEIWNEPNAAGFFAPTPDPGHFVKLLKSAYPAIKKADPAAIVITGGLGAIVDLAPIAMDAVKFVRQMYAEGAKNYFDAIGYHPYQYTMKFSEGGYHPDSPMNQLAAMRQLMLANGDGAKRIWATEYGEPSSIVGEAGQAAYLEDMLSKWRSLPYAGPIYVYTMRDRDSRSTEGDDTLGMYRSDGSPKPVQQVIATYAAIRGLPVRQVYPGPGNSSPPR